MRKVILIFMFIFSITLIAQVPSTISFQGRLADATGTAFDDDTYIIHFRLYESETGGSPVWEEYQDIITSNGLFSTMLGSETSFAGSVDFRSSLWLSIEVTGHGDELSPRYQLGTSPYAFVANYANESDIAHSISWDDIEDMPADFADGTDDTGEAYTSGEGINISARVISIENGGISSEMLSDMGAESGQVLKWNGSAWTPASDIGGGTGDDWGSQVVESNSTLEGNGTSSAPLGIANSSITNEHIVDNTIEASKLNNMGASSGQVLKYNGTAWAPASDIGGGTGDDWGSQVVESYAPLSGDGTSASPLLINPSDTDGQVLKTVDGNVTWASDIGGGSGDDWGSQTAETDVSLIGDGTSTDPLGIAPEGVLNSHLSENAVDGTNISDMGATSGQVLKYNGTEWAPASDIGGGSGDDWGTQVVISDSTLNGSGISGDPISIAASAVNWTNLSDAVKDSIQTSGGSSTGDDWGSQVVESDITLSGNGTPLSPLTIAPQSAISGQVLKWDGSNWTPAADEIGASGTGDITGVTAGDGLTGGGMSGDVTLNVEYDGTGSATSASRSDHNHDTAYSVIGHNHDADYAAIDHNHDSQYYRQEELSTSGSAEVHWDNLIGVPASSDLWEVSDNHITPTGTIGSNFKVPNTSEATKGLYSEITSSEDSSYAGYFKSTQTEDNYGFGIKVESYDTGYDNMQYTYGGYLYAEAEEQDCYGAYGKALNTGSMGFAAGVGGFGSSASGSSYGLRGFANGGFSAYGVYGTASDATNNWAGYFWHGNVMIKDNLLINSDSYSFRVPEHKLEIYRDFDTASPSNPVCLYVRKEEGSDTTVAMIGGHSSKNAIYGVSSYENGLGIYALSNGENGAGVYGRAIGSNSYGVYALGASSGTNYGLYASAVTGSTNWAGYFDNGNVHINNTLQIGDGAIGSHKLTAVGSGSSTSGSTGYFENTNSTGIGLMVTNTNESSSDVALLVNKKGTGDIVKFDQLDPWDIRFRFTIDGNGRCDGSWTGGGADFAEFFELANHSDRFEPGDVVVLSEKGYYVEATNEKYCGRVLGVYTTNPVVVGGSSAEEDPENAIPVGLLGVCPTKVCNENGAIEVGDYLTTSSTPGVAMKATESCVVIGRAMDNYDGNGSEKINVFVNAGWHDINSRYSELKSENDELRKRIEKLEQLIK